MDLIQTCMYSENGHFVSQICIAAAPLEHFIEMNLSKSFENLLVPYITVSAYYKITCTFTIMTHTQRHEKKNIATVS